MKMHNSQNPPPKSLFLPEEIMEEILSRLPVELLLKFRCVSKAWLSLIDNDRFIKIHFLNSTKNANFANHRVVYNVKQGVMNGCSLPSLLNSNSEEVTSSSINIDPTNNLPKTDYVVGCCNGVLCLSSLAREDGSFVLWNPATRVFIELPKLDRLYRKCGFGWDETSGEFKVFASTINAHDYNERSGQVYSSKTNSWKPVPIGATSLFSSTGVFVAGWIHWAGVAIYDSYECVIESFNLVSDEFGKIELPTFADGEDGCRHFQLLGEIGGRLCTSVFYTENADVWVMKEYGVKGSWFKMFTFSLISSYPHPLYIGLNEEVFIINVGCVFVALSTATKMKFLCVGSIYVESLVSPYVNEGL